MEGFINSVDSQMRLRQEHQKLATVSARIDSYEAVEGSSEEVEKVVPAPFWPNEGSSGRRLTSATSSADPEGVQPLRPDGSHERNVSGGDPTAAPGGGAEDEGGQRQSGNGRRRLRTGFHAFHAVTDAPCLSSDGRLLRPLHRPAADHQTGEEGGESQNHPAASPHPQHRLQGAQRSR